MSTYQDYEIQRLEYLKNFRQVLEKAKTLILNIDPESRIIFFGSVLSGDFNACSDIDLLVIPSDFNLKDKITIAIWKNIDAPLELHVVTKEQFEEWYLRFIDTYEEL